MGKEDNIFKKVGTKNPFSVPDRYFEQFSQELMAGLPEKETPALPSEATLWERVKPWIYMTAMFVGLMLCVRIFVGEPKKEEFPHITQTETENISAEEWELILKRSLMTDYDLYQFLTEANLNDYE